MISRITISPNICRSVGQHCTNLHWIKIIWFTLAFVFILSCYLLFQYFMDPPNTVAAQIVCITRKHGQTKPAPVEGTWYACEKAYDLPGRSCNPIQKYITIYQENAPSWMNVRKLGGFLVHYRPISKLPSTYTIITNQTAYFIGNKYDFEPENFYHFTKQVYFPLFHLIKSTNQLRDDANNIVFYPRIYGVCPHGVLHYHDINRYKNFLDILHVKNQLELSAFHDKPDPHQVCFKNAIFSSEVFLDRAAEATDYFKDKVGVSDKPCTSNMLVILNRTFYRRILNIKELENVGILLGYDTRVVVMETLSLKEQAQLIHCTTVLAGVTGAELQWSFFMKNHSGVVEIGYEHWPLFFTGRKAYNSEQRDVIRPLNFVSVTNATCHVNPKALNQYYEELYHTKGNFLDKESIDIVNEPRNYHFEENTVTNLGKICDVVVDTLAFKNALLKVGKNAGV